MSIVPHPKQQHLSENAGNINTNELVDDATNITIDKNNNPDKGLFFGWFK